MTYPNTFILGAPKCGTTSLAKWLALHPDVFLCPGKEPHYFNSDSGQQLISDDLEYRMLFAGAGDRKVIIDASVWYLMSKVAVSEIERKVRDARYIICARNPLDAVMSLYMEHRFSGIENSSSFDDAWKAQEQRRSGRLIPPLCRDGRLLDYGSVYQFASQVDRIFKYVPRDRVHFVLLDDVVVDPVRALDGVSEFLGLSAMEWPELSRSNAAKARYVPFASLAISRVGRMKERLGVKRSLGLLRALNKINTVAASRPTMSEVVRQDVINTYKPDVVEFGRLLDRNLVDKWKFC
jgi:hypothetical protein